jgi:hypothetical protein
VEHLIVLLVEFVRWLDGRLLKPLRRAVPDLDQLLADPRGTLAGQPVTIGPARKYASSVFLGLLLALFLGSQVFVVFIVLAGPGKLFGNRHAGLLVLLALFLAVLLVGMVWLVVHVRRGGEVVLREDGVELRYRRSAVFCPWALFNAPGQPFLTRPELMLLPVAPEAVPFVEVRDDGSVRATGRQVKTKQLRFKSATEASLHAFYEVYPAELGTLLLRLGRVLGTTLPAVSATPPLEPATAAPVEAGPAVMDADGWITARLTRLVFPPFCCDCGAATDQVQEFRGYVRLLRLGRFLTFDGGEFAALVVPVCRACRRDNSWRHMKASLVGIGLGVAVPLLIGLVLHLATGRAVPLFPLLLGVGLGLPVGVVIGGLVGQRLAAPVKLERYSPSRGTIALRFRWPAYGERLVAFLQVQEHVPAEAVH